MSSCASYVARTHDVIDDVTRSQSRSKFEIDISPSIFKLQRRSKAQHGGHLENFEILNTASKDFTSDMKRSSQIRPKKCFHDDDVIDGVTGWPQSRPSIFLYKWNNNIFYDNLKTSKDIIIKLPVHRYHELMTTIYLRQYLSYSVDQILKMSDMLMAIVLVYSTSGVTSGKKVCGELKMAAILKIFKYLIHLQFDLRYEKIVPNYAKKSVFMMMTSSMASQGGLKVGPLYSFINETTTFFMIT